MDCTRQRKKQWRKDNLEKAQAYHRNWHKRNPGVRLKYDKKYSEANPETRRQSANGWYERNKEQARETSSRWQKANRETKNATWHRYYARKLAATVPGQPVTAAVIAERFALFDGCAYCGADEKLTVDHFTALNNGGLHVASNLVGACGCCNSSKRDNPVEEWFRSQPFFSVERWERLNEVTCA